MAIARIPGSDLVNGVVEYALFTLDPQGHVTSWNDDAERIVGYQAGEILGRHFSAFYSEEQRSAGVPAVALATAERNGSYEAEGWRVSKDGNRFMASVLIQPLRDTSGRLTGFAKLVAEISGRPRPHQAATHPDTLARPTGKAVHDYNNALHVITGGLELLRRRISDSDAAATGLLDMVMQHLQQAVSLTRKFFIAPDSAEMRGGRGQAPVGEPAATTGKSRTRQLRGLRVLVVEDESLVRMLIEDLLDQLDCRMIGAASNVEKALEMATRSDIDVALLDVKLGEERVDRVAEALQARRVPFVFISGYGAVAERWRSRPAIQKPFELEQLRRAIERALGD